MPRNRYTKLVRQRQCAQISKQEKELAAIAQRLDCQDEAVSDTPLTTITKARRNARLEQKRRRKSESQTPTTVSNHTQ